MMNLSDKEKDEIDKRRIINITRRQIVELENKIQQNQQDNIILKSKITELQYLIKDHI